MYPPLNLWCFPSKIHSLFVSGYVTSISNSYLVTCRNVDLDFLPLFPCHQEQLPILGAVIGYSRGSRGLCCTALCRWVSPLRSGTSWRFDVQRSLVSGLSLFPDVRLVSWKKNGCDVYVLSRLLRRWRIGAYSPQRNAHSSVRYSSHG